MQAKVYSATGTEKGTVELPKALFEAPINKGLMHLALMRQQGNARTPVAHARHRGEMVGSTKKLFAQKGTGQARRGPVRSPLLKGGGKSFGPRNNANFTKDMPKKMRRAALFSCLSMRAKDGAVVALENYPDEVKTKSMYTLLEKMKLELGRRIVIVLPARHKGLELSARNIAGVKTILAPYMNPEDILAAKHVVFMVDALKVAADTFADKGPRAEKEPKPTKPRTPKAPKKVAAKKPAKKAAPATTK